VQARNLAYLYELSSEVESHTHYHEQHIIPADRRQGTTAERWIFRVELTGRLRGGRRMGTRAATCRSGPIGIRVESGALLESRL